MEMAKVKKGWSLHNEIVSSDGELQRTNLGVWWNTKEYDDTSFNPASSNNVDDKTSPKHDRHLYIRSKLILPMPILRRQQIDRQEDNVRVC